MDSGEIGWNEKLDLYMSKPECAIRSKGRFRKAAKESSKEALIAEVRHPN